MPIAFGGWIIRQWLKDCASGETGKWTSSWARKEVGWVIKPVRVVCPGGVGEAVETVSVIVFNDRFGAQELVVITRATTQVPAVCFD